MFPICPSWEVVGVYDLVQKRMTTWIFPKGTCFENMSRFKTRCKKIMRFTQCIIQVGMRLCKKNFWKMCDIEANIEFFALLNWCDPTFSQIEIIIKFFKKFVKEGLNFSQMALCEGLSYRKCEILWLLSCIA